MISTKNNNLDSQIKKMRWYGVMFWICAIVLAMVSVLSAYTLLYVGFFVVFITACTITLQQGQLIILKRLDDGCKQGKRH